MTRVNNKTISPKSLKADASSKRESSTRKWFNPDIDKNYEDTREQKGLGFQLKRIESPRSQNEKFSPVI